MFYHLVDWFVVCKRLFICLLSVPLTPLYSDDKLCRIERSISEQNFLRLFTLLVGSLPVLRTVVAKCSTRSEVVDFVVEIRRWRVRGMKKTFFVGVAGHRLFPVCHDVSRLLRVLWVDWSAVAHRRHHSRYHRRDAVITAITRGQQTCVI